MGVCTDAATAPKYIKKERGVLNLPNITFPLFGEGFVLSFSNYFTIFGFRIFYYGPFLALGLIAGALYAMKRAKEFGLTADNVLDFLIYAVPMALIVSRLYYVLFHNFSYFLQNPLRIITGVRDGGLTIYGVIFGAVFGAWLCGRIKKLDFFSFLDVGGLGLLLGQAIGRWGNFMNREIFGVETDLPWRMGLQTGETTVYVHPLFLYESLWNIAGLLLLHFFFKPEKRLFKGQMFLVYLAWYGLGRMWLENLRPAQWVMNIGTSGISMNFIIAVVCFVGALAVNIILSRRVLQKRVKTEE